MSKQQRQTFFREFNLEAGQLVRHDTFGARTFV